MGFRNNGEGNWFDDPRMGRDRGVTKYGDERLTWDAAYFARTGYAIWEVWVDGKPMRYKSDFGREGTLEVCGSSASDARRELKAVWTAHMKEPWPGHKRIVLKFVEVHG